MSQQRKPFLRTSAARAALLLLAATASGCGVGLPTQPDLAQAAGDQRLASAMSVEETPGPVEIDDPVTPGSELGDPGASIAPAPELVFPTPGHGGHGHKPKKKPKSRH